MTDAPIFVSIKAHGTLCAAISAAIPPSLEQSTKTIQIFWHFQWAFMKNFPDIPFKEVCIIYGGATTYLVANNIWQHPHSHNI